MDPLGILMGVFGLAVGGLLKGATGAGAPIIAVPLLAMVFDVPTAIALFTLPNLFSNIWQGWVFRTHRLPARFVLNLAFAGAIGAGLGTLLLVRLSSDVLQIGVAVTALTYVAFKLARPDWTLKRQIANRLAFPIGLLGGALQGAAGVSAPISMTFLNSMNMERPQFIATISIFFAAMAVAQIPVLFWLGILTPDWFGLSFLATIPLFATMPIGRWLGRRMSREAFDKIILILLAIIAARLIFGVLL